MAADGLVSVPSRFGPQETLQRLEKVLEEKGVTILARIDHAAGARDAGLALPPTQVIIFGNAKAGTPLMQADQTMGIDLPLKALIWTDAAGKTWLAYNDPAWLAKRHGLGPDTSAAVAAIATGLATFAKAATSAPE
jgi:uncharacterized protein (DUF302 family)